MIGSILGGMAMKKSAKQAAAAQAAALAEQRARLDGISIPEAKRLVVEEMVSAGTLSPEMAEAFELPESEVAKISEDASLRENQKQAIELIKQRADSGMSFADRADFNETRNAVARDQQAKQAQILQQMQARGMGGSGAELAMQLAQSQNSAQQASEEGDRMAANASRNAMAAAAQMGSMSGDLRSADMNVANTKASAADEYNRFNVTNKQNVANSNVGARNQAQQFNLTNEQNLSNANVANRRDEDVRYQNALQTRFQNEMNKATGQNQISAAQGENAAQSARAQGQATAGMWKGIEDAGMKGAAMLMTGGASAAMPSGGSGVTANTDTGSFLRKGSSLLMAHGGEVPGEAPVEGDHPANDIQPAKLSPGEVVLPRSVTQSENPSREAAKFMKEVEKQKAFDAASFLAKFVSKKGNRN